MSGFNVIRRSLLEWYDSEGEVLILNEEEGFLSECFSGDARVISTSDSSSLWEMCEKNTTFDLIIMYDLYDFCIKSETPVRDMIEKLLSIKKDDGTLFLAMENKLGLKYFAGCGEEQKGDYYVGIEDYNDFEGDICPLSKKEVEDVLNSFEGVDYQFYYPYPDYKYPTVIFTDDCLPKEGELFRNIRNIDRDRYVMFDERRAFDSVIKAGLFPDLANSFLISIGSTMKLIYTKYSTDRDKRFAIRTDRLLDSDNKETIIKVPLFPEAEAHLSHMVEMSAKLQERYEDKLIISESAFEDSKLYNEYIEGISYAEHFLDLIRKKDIDNVKEELNKYRDIIYYSKEGEEPFEITPEFREVFGPEAGISKATLKTAPVTDIDMILDNIIVDNAGNWNLIDYEWTFDFPIPREFVLYRTIHYLYNESPIDTLISWDDMMGWAGIDKDLCECFDKMEESLQNYIMGDTETIERALPTCGTVATSLDTLRERAELYEESIKYRDNYNNLIKEHNRIVNSPGYKNATKLKEYNDNIKNIYLAKENYLNDMMKELDKTRKELAGTQKELGDVNMELHNIKESKWYKVRNKLKGES